MRLRIYYELPDKEVTSLPLTLPDDVEKEKIEAKVNDGVLHTTLHSTTKDEKETKRIEVA